MARLRRAPSTTTAAATAKPTRQALRDRTNTAPRKPFVYEDDGDAEPLVKDARPKRGRGKKMSQDADEYIMAGGLGLRESDANVGAQTDPPMTTDELAKSDGPLRLSGKGVRPVLTKQTAAQSKAQTKAANGAKNRSRQPVRRVVASKSKDLPDDRIVVSSSEAVSAKPAAGRKSNGSRKERSDFSLSPSPPPAEMLNSAKHSSLIQPGSGLRTSGTPAVESSILALKNFKRRPRQPSMLQMVQQRTASARPSMQNTSATARAPEQAVESSDLDDEDDFAPEAEGTPVLKKTKAFTAGAQKAASKEQAASNVPSVSASRSKKRKSDEADHSSSALDALKAKRQKLSKPNESLRDRPIEPSSLRRSSSTPRRTLRPELTSDVQVIHSSSSTPPTDPPSPHARTGLEDPDEVVPSTEKEDDVVIQQDPANYLEDDWEDELPNGTMADPVSSPLQSSPPQGTQQTDIMADPLTQISPPKPKIRDKKAEKKARPLNTADLQALLPKRRKPLQPRHRKSEYDIDSETEDDDSPVDTSHLAADEDELSSSVRRKTKSRTPAPSRKSTTAKSRKSKAAPPSRKSKAAPPSRNSAATSRKSKAGKALSKTYGSDKENEAFEDADIDDSVLPDTSISGLEAAKSTELEAIRAKFAELDGWEMEFESVHVEEGRSSSQLWR